MLADLAKPKTRETTPVAGKGARELWRAGQNGKPRSSHKSVATDTLWPKGPVGVKHHATNEGSSFPEEGSVKHRATDTSTGVLEAHGPQNQVDGELLEAGPNVDSLSRTSKREPGREQHMPGREHEQVLQPFQSRILLSLTRRHWAPVCKNCGNHVAL